MSEGLLAYRNAETHVRLYSEAEDSDALHQHAEAMACRNCEDLIHMAIDAFQWIIRADQSYRIALYSGGSEDLALEKAIPTLCVAWLQVSSKLESRIKFQFDNGFSLDRLEDYRHCVSEMAAIVESLDDGEIPTLPESLIAFRDAAIQESKNGETAEFF